MGHIMHGVAAGLGHWMGEAELEKRDEEGLLKHFAKGVAAGLKSAADRKKEKKIVYYHPAYYHPYYHLYGNAELEKRDAVDAREEEFWNHIAHGIAAGLNSRAGKAEIEKRDLLAKLEAKDEEFWNHIMHGVAAGLGHWMGEAELEKRDEEFWNHIAHGIAAGLNSWAGKAKLDARDESFWHHVMHGVAAGVHHWWGKSA